ncbi:YceI family protein [Agromyces seonyuensis]|uniref:YceI family protein n=1 Tax=Agromyces seonyuensis TaxID=2662446 RepID=A0A6I4P0G2_9MICO|nr:YceI family protein [Agromyces seonyuensis]MWC00071.1 YceI family protein [Agromyces seonyuensis]
MEKRTKVILGVAAGLVVVGGVAAVAGPIVYRDVIVGEQAAAPTITLEPSTVAPGASEGDAVDDLSGTWTAGSGSYAGYRVDEVLNGTDVTVVGRTEDVTGTATVEGLQLTAAEFTVDVASIETDSSSRDGYFRDSALRVQEFPTATFVLTGVVDAPETPAVGEVQTLTVTGDLTIAGVTQPVEVELQAVFDGESGQVAGSIPITFADYGVEAPNLGFVSVEDAGFVEFSLALTQG